MLYKDIKTIQNVKINYGIIIEVFLAPTLIGNFMSNIRDGLIQLGFYRTMYAEDKRSSIEGVYDGTYKNVFMSIEIFSNGYIARVEEEHPANSGIENNLYINNLKETASIQNESLAVSIPQDSTNVAIIHSEIPSPFALTIRSEVLSMYDILHSLDKLICQVNAINKE